MPVRRLNHAVLYVNGLDREVDFYTRTLGFEVRLQIPGQAAFLRSPGSANDHDLGLFDVHGNSSAWCQEQYQSYPQGANLQDDIEDTLTVDGQFDRVLRGGSFYDMASNVRSAQRITAVPTLRYNLIGFRPARTYR